MRAIAIALLAAGCATFEDPTIVLDLRVIGMTARTEFSDFAEHVIDVDLMGPPRLDEVLDQLNEHGEQQVCATVADPGRARAINWSMTACALDDNRRCDPTRPQVHLGASRLADPETARRFDMPGFTGGEACVRYAYDQELLALLLDMLERDPARGLGGLDYAIELRAGAEDETIERDLFAYKQIRIAPRIPLSRQPNTNPLMTEVQIAINFGGGFPTQPKHCADPPTAGSFDIEVDPGDVVTLYPVEADGTREEFVLPTIDGQVARFTEVMTYQWLGAGGSFSDDITGGPPDIFGNTTLLGTDWTAPAVSQLTQIPVWVIQRDERYGVSMQELCMRVRP